MLAPDGKTLLGEIDLEAKAFGIIDPMTGNAVGIYQTDSKTGESQFYDFQTQKAFSIPENGIVVIGDGKFLGSRVFGKDGSFKFLNQENVALLEVTPNQEIIIRNDKGIEERKVKFSDLMILSKQEEKALSNKVTYENGWVYFEKDRFRFSGDELSGVMKIEDFAFKFILGAQGVSERKSFLSVDMKNNYWKTTDKVLRELLTPGSEIDPIFYNLVEVPKLYHTDPADDGVDYKDQRYMHSMEDVDALFKDLSKPYQNLSVSIGDRLLGAEQMIESRAKKIVDFGEGSILDSALKKILPSVPGQPIENVLKSDFRSTAKDLFKEALPGVPLPERNFNLANVNNGTRADFKKVLQGVWEQEFSQINDQSLQYAYTAENKITQNEIDVRTGKNEDKPLNIVSGNQALLDFGVSLVKEKFKVVADVLNPLKKVEAVVAVAFNANHLDPTQTERITVVRYGGDQYGKERIMTMYTQTGFTSDGREEIQHIKVVIGERGDDATNAGATFNYGQNTIQSNQFKEVKTYEFPKWGEN
jgi:hypothetical protein